MPYGTSTLSVEQKAHAAVRFEYDEVGLARLVIGDGATPLSLSLSMNANDLEQLLAQGARLLDHMMDVQAIGVDTLNQRNAAAVERLGHLVAAPPVKRMSEAEAAELRRLAILEVQKVRDAKARGEYA